MPKGSVEDGTINWKLVVLSTVWDQKETESLAKTIVTPRDCACWAVPVRNNFRGFTLLGSALP